MNVEERRAADQKIWRVTPKETVRNFSILNAPSLTYENKESWFRERRKENLEKKLQQNRIF